MSMWLLKKSMLINYFLFIQTNFVSFFYAAHLVLLKEEAKKKKEICIIFGGQQMFYLPRCNHKRCHYLNLVLCQALYFLLEKENNRWDRRVEDNLLFKLQHHTVHQVIGYNRVDHWECNFLFYKFDQCACLFNPKQNLNHWYSWN